MSTTATKSTSISNLSLLIEVTAIYTYESASMNSKRLVFVMDEIPYVLQAEGVVEDSIIFTVSVGFAKKKKLRYHIAM